jgi:hypothetical protein
MITFLLLLAVKLMRAISSTQLFFQFRNRVSSKIKRLVAQTALQLYHSSMNTPVSEITQTDSSATSIEDDQSGPNESSSVSVTPKRKSLFSYCETSPLLPKKIRTDIIDEINEEIMLYLKDQRYESDLIFSKKAHCPHLHRLAMRVLCVPATSASAERVFSRSGLLMRPHRSRLNKDTLAKLTFVKCNLDLLR